jgi:WD40 repeat protein
LANPFKGLRAFSEADAENFFGRETLVQQLLARMAEGGDLSRFLAVIGPSGSGKSSVVRAGLIPALRRGGLPGSENWFVVDMLPGKHPFEELEASLLRVAVNPPESLLSQLKDGARGLLRAVRRILPADDSVELVLMIDQFEEVFTLIEDETERALFLESLATAALDERSRVRVLVTLRADFTDKPLRYVDFGELLNRRFEFVLPLTPDEIERAVVGPVQRVGLKLEKGLVSTIIRDVGNQPGTLPLLQYALSELFEKRDSRMLTNKAYKEIGGVLGALGRSAEAIYVGMGEAGRAAARQLFLRLVTLGEGKEDTRRRVLREEIEALQEDHQAAIRKIIDLFGKARLLSFDRDPLTRGATIEVAHEALLHEWTRLREWLNESRADVRIQRQLANAMQEWNNAGQDTSFLMTGSRLEQFEGWSANTSIALTHAESAFLYASIAERDHRELEEQARQVRELQAAHKLAETERQSVINLRSRNRVITTIGVVALVLAVMAGIFGLSSNRNAKQALNAQATSQAEAQSRATAEANALTERNTAQQQSLVSSVRELSSEANLNLDIDPERSILLALQAVNKTYAINQSVLPEAQDALHRAVQASSVELTLRGHTGVVRRAVFSPDGMRIATASADGTAKIWDAANGKELLTLLASSEGWVDSVAFSPDGKLLATAGDDKTARIWESATGKELLTLKGHLDWVSDVIFNQDGSMLASSSADGTIKVWDVLTGKELLTLREEDGAQIISMAFSLDGSQIADVANPNSGLREGWTSIWNASTGQMLFTLRGHTTNVESVTFSHDGARIVTTGDDSTAKIWDAHTGNLLLTLYGHTDIVYDAAFSPDDDRIATVSGDRQIKIWDAITGRELFSLAGHSREIRSVAFSPNGTHIVTASADQTAKVWRVTPSREFLTLVNGPVIRFIEGTELAYSSDGARLATASSDRTPKVWDATSGTLLFSLIGHTDIVTNIAYSTDGTRIATASNDGTAKIWDGEAGKELLTLIGHKDWVSSVAFNSDGSRLATGSFDKTAKIWDAQTGKEVLTLAGHKDWILSVAFSPDDTRLATASADGTAIVWDVITGKELFTLNHASLVQQVVFSPDGTCLATASFDGTAKVWDANTGKELFTLSGHSGTLFDVRFSRDGRYLATVSVDKTAKIWDANTGKELLTLYAPASLTGVDFSPDGSQLAVGSSDGTTRIYLLRIEDVIEIAISRLTRTWTLEECQTYLHSDTCPANP